MYATENELKCPKNVLDLDMQVLLLILMWLIRLKVRVIATINPEINNCSQIAASNPSKGFRQETSGTKISWQLTGTRSYLLGIRDKAPLSAVDGAC